MTLEERIEKYEKELEILQFDSFTNEDALAVGNLMAKRVVKEKLVLTVGVHFKEHIVFRYAPAGTGERLEPWLKRKSNTVLLTGDSSILFGAKLKRDNKTVEDVIAENPENYAPQGGAFPIIVKGQGVMGTFCSSGLTDDIDHQVLVDAVSEYLGVSL